MMLLWTEGCKYLTRALLQAGAITQLVECLPGMCEALDLIPVPRKLGMGVRTCNLSIWKVEAGGSEIHPQLYNKFMANQDT